ncbi:MAG: DUF5672 family protein [Janthinobacterium lividum]
MLKKVAVIIPFYRSTLSAYEIIALQQCELVLSEYPKIAIKPANLTLPAGSETVSFNDMISFENCFFEGIAGYNHLMLSPEFYKTFLDYEYILIYQLDAFVFKNDLEHWCNQNLDYIGAPWIRKKDDKSIFKKVQIKLQSSLYTYFNIHQKGLPSRKQFTNKVGNGGLSLRRVKKFYDLTITMKSSIDFYLSQTAYQYNEDSFWSIEVNRKEKVLNIPTWKVGLKFAFETYPEKAYFLNKQILPFGCHDWDKYLDFWRPIFKLYNYNI